MPPLDETTRRATERYYAGMVQARRNIVVPLVLMTLAFFFVQQILTNFTPVLDGLAFSGMTWAYLYAFAQFFLVVILTTVYSRRMQQVEERLRPPTLDETAAHYEDWPTWQAHESELQRVDHELGHLQEAGLEAQEELQEKRHQEKETDR